MHPLTSATERKWSRRPSAPEKFSPPGFWCFVCAIALIVRACVCAACARALPLHSWTSWPKRPLHTESAQAPSDRAVSGNATGAGSGCACAHIRAHKQKHVENRKKKMTRTGTTTHLYTGVERTSRATKRLSEHGFASSGRNNNNKSVAPRRLSGTSGAWQVLSIA